MKLYSLTDIGSTRKENQDNYWSAILNVNNEEAGVLCLCDGMGGLNNGGMASRLVVEAVRDYFLNKFIFEGIEDVLRNVNRKIFSMSEGNSKNLMGTTCTLIVLYRGIYKICHIGDSRAYVIRDGNLNQLTTDHSAVNMYGISKQDNPVLWGKYKNKLTRCIGVKEDIYFDYYTGSYFEGDKFFVCSDGCWHFFDNCDYSDCDICDLKSLFANCISHGEKDNITAGVICIL